MKILIMLLLVASCGKDPVKGKAPDMPVTQNSILSPQAPTLVEVECSHAPTCFRKCRSLDSSDQAMNKCLARMIKIDQEYTDVEIIKYCHTETNGSTTCPKTELDTDFTFLN